MTRRILNLVLMAWVVCASSATANMGIGADFVVAPNGDDTAAGTMSEPFATIERAQLAARQTIADGLEKSLTIIIRGGRYELDRPLHFQPEDGGTTEHRVAYRAMPGEQVVVSGGKTITGWERTQATDTWSAGVPGVADGERWFRQLFADGRRLSRARFPNSPEALRIESVSEDVKTITVDQAIPADLSKKDRAELVVIQHWAVTRGAVVEACDASLKTGVPMGWIGHGSDYLIASAGKAAYVENAAAFLDAPDEWYLDPQSGRLSVRLSAGSRPGDQEIIAPALEHLLIVRGDRDRPVRNLHFNEITFEHTRSAMPDIGYVGIQAGHHGSNIEERVYVLPAAVELEYATGCRFERCRFRHLGATGIGLGAGCRNNKVIGSEIADCGGTGVMFGLRRHCEFAGKPGNTGLMADWQDPQDIPTGNAVESCFIHEVGQVFFGCAGVYDAYCRDSRIAHNRLENLPYTGISIGFRWDTEPTSQQKCIVEYNHVFNVMTLLADGGAIYTLGYQPGTVLRGNLLNDVQRSRYSTGAPNNGLFFDQGSKGYVVENNIVFNSSGDPIRFNMSEADWMTFRNNHLGIEHLQGLQLAEHMDPQPGLLPQYRDFLMPTDSQ